MLRIDPTHLCKSVSGNFGVVEGNTTTDLEGEKTLCLKHLMKINGQEFGGIFSVRFCRFRVVNLNKTVHINILRFV